MLKELIKIYSKRIINKTDELINRLKTKSEMIS